MATHSSIPPPSLLHIDAVTAVNFWHQWKSVWIEYEDLDKKTCLVLLYSYCNMIFSINYAGTVHVGVLRKSKGRPLVKWLST